MSVPRVIRNGIKDGGLHYHPVSHLYILYAMSDLFYHAGKFMSEGLPFFSGIARQNLVVSAESAGLYSHKYFSGLRLPHLYLADFKLIFCFQIRSFHVSLPFMSFLFCL